MNDTGLSRALAKVVGERRVLSSRPDQLAYARDCWPRMTIRARDGDVNPMAPELIVQPGSEAEVSEVVRLAEEEGIALIPYGAGSGVCGGVVPFERAITVDVKRLRHLVVDEDNLTARIGPGVIGQHLETELLRSGYTMGHYPSSLYCSSVGGYVAARSAGQYSSRYGKIEDMVESVRMVSGGGEIIDTATAQDSFPGLLQLVVGSEGTLGIITDNVLRLNPAPAARAYRGFMMPNAEAGTEAIRELMQSGLRPAVVRLYDQIDTLVGGKSADQRGGEEKPGMFQRLFNRARATVGEVVPGDVLEKLVARTSKRLMGRVLGQPLLLQRAAELIPGGCMLVVGFEGPETEVATESALAFDMVSRHGEDAGPGPGEHWYEHRFSVSYKMSPVMDTGAFTDTMEVSTTWSNLMPLYSAVRRAMSPHVLVMAHFSHAYPDGCSIYFTFAGFAQDLESTLQLYDRAWDAGLGAVADAGASVAHHHGVGHSKSKYTAFDHPGGAPIMSALKSAFDPHGIFNPGKVWPASMLAEDGNGNT